MIHYPTVEMQRSSRMIVLALVFLVTVFVAGFIAQTVHALELQERVQSLTVQNATCDGTRITLEADKTSARMFLIKSCDSWSLLPS